MSEKLRENGAFARHAGRHPSITGVLRFMEYDHLRDGAIREVSQIFAYAANEILDAIPDDDPELAVALRKLREAKDSAVGLAVYQVAGPNRTTTIK